MITTSTPTPHGIGDHAILAVAFGLLPLVAMLTGAELRRTLTLRPVAMVIALAGLAAGAAVLGVTAAVVTEASLSFLGVGVPPPEPSIEAMLSGAARRFMLAAPWMAVFPTLAVVAFTWHGLAAGQALLEASRDGGGRS
ncbi:MAG: hypothetical protein HYY05_03920 [Chloroflexi bacterium]|nr:hypothetical protein [Chloroflexota bacterium]